MATTNKPKGGKIEGAGRKGGTRFPNLDLKKAVEYSKKLVSKTFTSTQSSDIIFPGVFNSKGPSASIKASALRQYGLLEGDNKALSASQLARDINVAEGSELIDKLRSSFFQAKIFKILFDTFKNDKVSIQRIKQQAQNQRVHADLLESCVAFFITSLEYCGLGKVEADGVQFYELNMHAIPDHASDDQELEDSEEDSVPDSKVTEPEGNAKERSVRDDNISLPSVSSNVTVNLTLDSTMDSDKLEKQLSLLKKYGVLK